VQEKKGYEPRCQLIEDERLNEHEHIYTDGLLKEEQVGCAVVMLSPRLSTDCDHKRQSLMPKCSQSQKLKNNSTKQIAVESL
jgi:hypothetical protein